MDENREKKGRIKRKSFAGKKISEQGFLRVTHLLGVGLKNEEEGNRQHATHAREPSYTFSAYNIRLPYVDGIFEKSERPSVIKVWKYSKWGCAATYGREYRRDMASTIRFCDLVFASVRQILDYDPLTSFAPQLKIRCEFSRNWQHTFGSTLYLLSDSLVLTSDFSTSPFANQTFTYPLSLTKHLQRLNVSVTRWANRLKTR